MTYKMQLKERNIYTDSILTVMPHTHTHTHTYRNVQWKVYLNLSKNSWAMESAYCMNTRLAAMLSMTSFTLPNASLSTLARGPCNMEHRAVMISAFSTPSQGNLHSVVKNKKRRKKGMRIYRRGKMRYEGERKKEYKRNNEGNGMGQSCAI